MKKVVSVSLSIDDIVDKIMDKMKEKGFENIEWVGDRSGEWLYGVGSDLDEEDLKINVDLDIEVEEYINWNKSWFLKEKFLYLGSWKFKLNGE